MTTPQANPWLGLGARAVAQLNKATRTTRGRGGDATTSDDDDAVDAFARPSVQRIVPAAGLPLPVSLPASLTVITAAPEPTPEPTPAPTQQPTEEAPAMASKPTATTPGVTPTPTGLQHHTTHGNGEPRQAVLMLLDDAPGGLTRKQMVEKLGWPWKKVTNTTYNAFRLGLVEMDAGGAYFLTVYGKDWLVDKEGKPARKVAAAASTPGLAARRDKAAQTKAPAAKKVVDVPQHDAAQATAARGRAVQAADMLARVMQVTGTLARPAVAQQASADSTVVAPPAPTFRAAVYTDGSFHLSKAGQSIELTADEHAKLLRYLERMAEAD